MLFCSKCGKKCGEGEAFCNGCGARLADSGGSQQQNTGSNQHQNTGGDFFANILNTPETNFESNDIAENKGMALLSYIFFLFVIPLFAAPNSKFARYHANQGLILFIVSAAFGLVLGLLGVILRWMIFGWMIMSLFGLLFSAIVAGYMVLGIINAANGKAKELPFIGRFKILN